MYIVVTSRIAKLFCGERANIAHIQSGATYVRVRNEHVRSCSKCFVCNTPAVSTLPI